MPNLQIVEIQDPNIFAEKIQIDQNDNLYVYTNDMFEPIDNIYEDILKIYNIYLCSIMFTDIQITYNNNISYQYFQDVRSNNDNKIVCSPIIARYTPIKLIIHPELEYHSFSFLKQATKIVLPWHVPKVGFKSTITTDQFKRLTEDSTWVTQHVT